MDLQAKLDIVKTDPYYRHGLDGMPLPDDRYLYASGGSLEDFALYLEMRRDAEVRRLLQRRKRATLARSLIVECAQNRSRDRDALQRAEEILDRIRYEFACAALLSTGPLIGFSVVQIDWERSGRYVLPRFKYVPQERFTFVAHQPERDIPSATGEKLDPMTEIHLVQGFELRLLTRSHPFTGERCPKNRFIVATFDNEGSPWGLGLGYSLYPWYFVKKQVAKRWLLHSDRAGSPPAIGYYPENMDETNPADAEQIAKFKNFLKRISPSGWGCFPPEYELKYLEQVGSMSPDVHERLIQTANSEMAKVVIGEAPYSDKKTGSYGAATAQNDTFAELIDGDCDTLDEQLNDQLWTAIANLNYPGSTVIVRRQTTADLKKVELDKAKEENLKARILRDIELNSMGYRLKPEAVSSVYGEEYEPILDSNRDADQPLLSTLGLEASSRLLQFLATEAVNMERAIALSILQTVFGLPMATASQLIPE